MSRKITNLVPEILLLEKLSPSLYSALQTFYSMDKIFGDDIKYKDEYEEGLKEVLLMLVTSYDLFADEPKKFDLVHIIGYCISIMNRRDFHAANVNSNLPETAEEIYHIQFNEDNARFYLRVGEVMPLCNGELYLLLNEFGEVTAASTDQHSFFILEDFARVTAALLNSIIVTYAILASKGNDEASRWVVGKRTGGES